MACRFSYTYSLRARCIWRRVLFCRSTGEECFAQRALRLFLETRKNLIHLAAPHLLRLFGGRITLIIAESQSLLKFIRANYFKNFICQ